MLSQSYLDIISGSMHCTELKSTGHLVTEAICFYDLLMKPGSLPGEKRIALDLLAVRAALQAGSNSIHWLPSSAQLADPLRKPLVQHVGVPLTVLLYYCNTSCIVILWPCCGLM